MIAAVRRALNQIGLGPLYDALLALEQAIGGGGGPPVPSTVLDAALVAPTTYTNPVAGGFPPILTIPVVLTPGQRLRVSGGASAHTENPMGPPGLIRYHIRIDGGQVAGATVLPIPGVGLFHSNSSWYGDIVIHGLAPGPHIVALDIENVVLQTTTISPVPLGATQYASLVVEPLPP